MNFDFSDDQKFLRDEARKFLEAQCTSAHVRAVLDDDAMSHNDEVWQKIVEMGWLGAAIPEEFGGLGLGMLELCVIAEELGRVLAPVPFGSSAFFFAEAIKLAGSDEQKAEWLPKVADGSIVGCLATTEGPGALSASSVQTSAKDGKLSGTKLPVTDGDVATHAAVLAKEGSGTGLYIVALDDDGVSRKSLKTIEPTRSHAEIKFNGASATRLGHDTGNGMTVLDNVMNRGAVLLAFEQLGGASRCLEMATEYAKERHAFGRPIGGNQAIKHKLADIYVKNEVARSNAYYGAWALSTDAAELPEAAAAARVAASEAFWFASKENIQTHGGMGFTWEVDCHLYYRRAKLLAVQAGSPAVWKEKLVSALEAKKRGLECKRHPELVSGSQPVRRSFEEILKQVQDDDMIEEKDEKMDFTDSTEEAAFRAEANAFLSQHLEPKKAAAIRSGRRDDYLQRAKDWQKVKAENQFAQITWPKEIGGRGGSSMQQVIWNQEEGKFDAPTGPFAIGLGMCVPTVIAFGSDEHKQRYVQKALFGEEIWCQLFSEPAAGSDVAGLKTKAVKDGDDWVINGQKVWTSGAHYSDYGIVLVRTDPDVPKHKGLTMFIVDMKQEGVDVRPIHQASGGSEFNEVYFTDVRIPDSDRLGEPGMGWKVALVTLMNERLAVGGSPGPDWAEIMDYARGSGSMSDAAFRAKLADWYVAAQGYKLTKFRTQTALSKGETPGPENSIGKVITANHLQDICNSAIEMQDHYGIISDKDHAPADAIFQESFMWAPGLRIAGGTDEILKNIIAERVLGLPQDVRVDKDKPFSAF